MLYLEKIDSKKLDNGILEYGPIECMNCQYDGPIQSNYYLIKYDKDSDFRFLDKEVKKQLGFDQFTQMCSDLGDIISVCRCPKCNSEDIFQDI